MSTIALNNSLFASASGATTGDQFQGNHAAGTSTGSDTVKLSATAQATLLYEQGLNVQEIASSLELTTAEVNSYLNLTTATTVGGTAGVSTNAAQPNKATTQPAVLVANAAAG